MESLEVFVCKYIKLIFGDLDSIDNHHFDLALFHFSNGLCDIGYQGYLEALRSLPVDLPY